MLTHVLEDVQFTFYRKGTDIFYCLIPKASGIERNLNLDLNLCDIRGIYQDSEIVGFRIIMPEESRVIKNSVLLGDCSDIDLACGLPGIQIYKGSNGILLLSNTITPSFAKIQNLII